MNQLPTGTVTFLFTDIQGSAPLAQDYPAELPALLARHNTILHEAIARHSGHVFRIAGDAFCAAFSTAHDGFAAAVDAQRALQSEPWQPAPISVRMGLHTGEAWAGVEEEVAGGYAGYLTLTRAQRVMSLAHGGQVLLSGAVAELLRGQLPPDVVLRDMGEHRLKGVLNPEHLWQVVAEGARHDFPPLASLNRIPTNLPVQLTSFIGRSRELGEIKALMRSAHLLTLTGIGGTGKTRLALEVAAGVIDEFPGGVWFVDLAPLRDPTLVPQTAVTTLGLPGQPGCSLSDLLIEHLQNKHLLLILDNCEHVVDACAQLAGALLAAAPGLVILATSRVPLNLGGETLYPVPPLSLPEPGRAASLPALTQYEAVRLFIVRGQAAKPAFGVTNANAPAVAQICQHLDGIPLAIELAAARLRLLSPEQIAARLGDRFNLLTGGSRLALPRQQTLRATLDWSYDLLTGPERALFRRLAVFTGSFALEAVEAICADGDDDAGTQAIQPAQVLDLLAALVDHSLVILHERPAENRYGLLETVRQYALEKLQASGELPVLQDRHLAHYLALAEEGEPHIWAGRAAWIDRFEIEYDNFRAAMAVALARNPESAVRLGNSLNQFASLGPQLNESYGWAMRILALTEAWPAGRMRAAALRLAGDHAVMFEEHQRAQELLEASLEMISERGDRDQVALALLSLTTLYWFWNDWGQTKYYADQLLTVGREIGNEIHRTAAVWCLGEAARFGGDNELAREYYEQVLALARQEDLPFIAAHALMSLGQQAYWEGNPGQARALYVECAQMFRRMKYPRGLINVLTFLGVLELQEGNPRQARSQFDEVLTLARELALEGFRLASLAGFAGVAGLSGQDERAALLFGAREAALESPGERARRRPGYEPIIAAVRERLGETAFDAAFAEGRKLTIEQALEYAREPDGS